MLTKLTDSEFGDMFERLLKNQNFTNIKKEESSIICEQRIMGRVTVFLFVLYTKRLSGLNREAIASIYHDIENRFQGFFGTKVKLDAGVKKGKIIIQYNSNDDLERILDLLK